MRPATAPIGLHISRAARTLTRGFDDALAQAGGSLPVWLVLLNLKANPGASQRDLAEAMGISEATLTHHLNAMDSEGLVTRHRDPANRRIHILELTAVGEDAFVKMRSAAFAFDERLRRGLSDEQVEALRNVLDDLVANVETGSDAPVGGARPTN